MELKTQMDQLIAGLKITEPTNSLQVLKQTSALTSEEKVFLSKKYAGKQIKDFTEMELFAHSKKLLLKIHAITGWVIPAGELLTALQDVFSKKLLLDYDNLNIEEIEYAFIKSGTIVEDYGKEFNLNLVDKVLIPYVNQRFQLSKIEEIKTVAPIQKIYTEEEILNQRRGEIEQAYQAIRKGYYPLLHTYFFEVLLHDGLLLQNSEPEWEGEVETENVSEFFVRKLNEQAENIYTK